MQNAYKYSVIYFLLFSLLLLASSVFLFEEKIGFSHREVINYYLGNEVLFQSSKTTTGLLKVLLPHIFGFGLFIMVVLHFLIFTSYNKSKYIYIVIIATFISGFFELFSSFFILYGFEFFAYIKLISFIVFQSLLLYIFWLLGSSIFYE